MKTRPLPPRPDYVNALRARLDREGKVKIYEDVLARNADEDEAAAPPP